MILRNYITALKSPSIYGRRGGLRRFDACIYKDMYICKKDRACFRRWLSKVAKATHVRPLLRNVSLLLPVYLFLPLSISSLRVVTYSKNEYRNDVERHTCLCVCVRERMCVCG